MGAVTFVFGSLELQLVCIGYQEFFTKHTCSDPRVQQSVWSNTTILHHTGNSSNNKIIIISEYKKCLRKLEKVEVIVAGRIQFVSN